MHSTIRIGSRESRLAVIQAEIIRAKIQKHHPEIAVELVTMKTSGDIILDRSLDQIGGKGLFVKELDQALRDERIDISVHSLKDMPMKIPAELPILAYGKREDPRDVMIYKPDRSEIPKDGVIGTSSRRRTIQMQALYPGCTFRSIRGNVQTRLRKLETEDYDGTVLAAAGLNRLGLSGVIGRIFAVEEVVPAAGQGILAIQGRAGEDDSWLECVNDPESTVQAAAERRFVTVLDGGCSSPIAAYARTSGNELKLTGLYFRESDETYYVESLTGNITEAARLGEKLALEMQQKWGC